jgi:tripartite-type tricarboxylate transporter receptor subunit TctC
VSSASSYARLDTVVHSSFFREIERMNRRHLLSVLAASSLPGCSGAARAQSESLTRIVTGSPAGTPGDVLGRALAASLGRLLGRSVIVVNKPGAIGTIALASVARSRPDGTTLGILSLLTTVAPHLLVKPAADPLRDVLPLRQLASWGNALVVQAEGPHRTLDQLVAAARSGTLAYASGGNGTPAHLAAELFRQSLGLQLQHVPFQGAVAGVNAVIGGHVAMMFATASAVMGPLEAGRLRAIAVSTPHRMPALPGVATLAELGHPDVAFEDWLGLAVPLATPPEIQARLVAGVSQALSTPEVQQRLSTLGFESPATHDSVAFASLVRTESARWEGVIRRAGIRAE